MSGIRGKDTKPELVIRSGLHVRGFRFRLHSPGIPGKPDLVFPKYKAVIFIHGCFWHGHRCHLFKWPSSRAGFWKKKIKGNIRNDIRNLGLLCRRYKLRILVIWECSLKGKTRQGPEKVLLAASSWLNSNSQYREIRGKDNR